VLATQVLYHLIHVLSPFCFIYLFLKSLTFLLGLAWTATSYLQFLRSWDDGPVPSAQLLLIKMMSCELFCLASNYDPLISTSRVAGITGMNNCAQPIASVFKKIVFIIAVLGVHCDIYKSPYNMS
jgi:hypothetical protein